MRAYIERKIQWAHPFLIRNSTIFDAFNNNKNNNV